MNATREESGSNHLSSSTIGTGRIKLELGALGCAGER